MSSNFALISSRILVETQLIIFVVKEHTRGHKDTTYIPLNLKTAQRPPPINMSWVTRRSHVHSNVHLSHVQVPLCQRYTHSHIAVTHSLKDKRYLQWRRVILVVCKSKHKKIKKNLLCSPILFYKCACLRKHQKCHSTRWGCFEQSW